MTRRFYLRIAAASRRLRRDTRAIAALETALTTLPFMVLVLGGVQMGVYFMSQSSLDTGVLRAAENIRANMLAGNYTPPTGASLKQTITTDGAVMLGGGPPVVEMRLLSNLSSAVVPIVDGTIDSSSVGNVLVIRASLPVFSFAPFMKSMTVTSAAMLRYVPPQS